ncbi:hypothetical protein [Bosea sp. RAC05]|uniref:hypothetical protein n=1 Tax=Bosea sp. RAC05 TaxID=1842539 RepID=UPI00083D6BCE|nr:hypothetical protein [Bosea sp. RAC05]AOG02832.1 hypothetical protein BSY19_5029 [Bosea sp. RAC05]
MTPNLNEAPRSRQPNSNSTRARAGAGTRSRTSSRAGSDFKRDIQPKLEAARRDWLVEARKIALHLGRTIGQVTADDVRKLIAIPKGVDGRVMGVLFNDGNWRCVGYRRSTRTECHHRPVGVHELIV